MTDKDPESRIVPAPIRDLLARPWATNAPYTNASMRKAGRLHADPPGYIMRPGSDPNPFTYEEALAIMKTGAIDGCTRERGEAIWLNEHAAHALEEFYAETQAAWLKCRARIDLAAARRPPARPAEPGDA